jgi:hypothetical protein
MKPQNKHGGTSEVAHPMYYGRDTPKRLRNMNFLLGGDSFTKVSNHRFFQQVVLI